MTVNLAPLFVIIQEYVDLAFAEENAALIAERDALQADLNEATAMGLAQAQTIAERDAQIVEMQTAINSYEAEIETLEAQIDGKNIIIAQQIAEISEKNEQLLQANLQIATLQNDLDARNVQIALQIAEIAALQAQIAQGGGGTLPSVSINDVAVLETAGNATFTVLLSGPYGKDILVDYTTKDGTAIASQDYTAKTGTVTFTAQSTSQTVPVAIINDTAVEGIETFTLELSNARVAVPISDNIGAVTITSEDTVVVPTPVPGLPDGAVTAISDVMALNGTNTGCRVDVSQLTVGGTITTTSNSQVIERRRVNGQINVQHSGVIIRDCVVVSGGYYGIFHNPETHPNASFTAEYCDVSGPDNGIAGGNNCLVYRCDISDTSNAINFFGSLKAVNVYIHNMWTMAAHPGAHNDGTENNGNSGTELLYSRILCSTSDDTSAIMITSYFSAINSGLVKGCYCEGGQYTVYVAENPGKPCVCRVEANTIKRGRYGHFYTLSSGATLVNNTLIG